MAYNKRTHLQTNIEAIKIAFALDRERRKATDEERAILQQYSGFGGIKCVLNSAQCEKDREYWKKSDLDMFPIVVEVNRLYIPKKNISQKALNRIKRLAAFSNPQFYKTQKMRMSTFGIPRIICSLDETAEFLGIPRGCKSSFIDLLENACVDFVFDDKRNKGKIIKVDFVGTLREEQQSAANALLEHETGVLSVPTAFGKTVIGASLIAERRCNALILVHLHTLFDQ